MNMNAVSMLLKEASHLNLLVVNTVSVSVILICKAVLSFLRVSKIKQEVQVTRHEDIPTLMLAIVSRQQKKGKSIFLTKRYICNTTGAVLLDICKYYWKDFCFSKQDKSFLISFRIFDLENVRHTHDCPSKCRNTYGTLYGLEIFLSSNISQVLM